MPRNEGAHSTSSLFFLNPSHIDHWLANQLAAFEPGTGSAQLAEVRTTWYKAWLPPEVPLGGGQWGDSSLGRNRGHLRHSCVPGANGRERLRLQ